MQRRQFITGLGAAALSTLFPHRAPAGQGPNVIMIYVDDLGYGDLGCYGSKIKTPNLDAMASEGARFRHFYSASPVCSPSRASLLTGRYGVRTGIETVLWPDDTRAIAPAETTIAEMLKPAGYRTSCVGKWHVGTRPGAMPTSRGFDEYFGIPYSHDQSPSILMRGTDIVESPVVISTLTQRYTQEALSFIRRSQDKPFFLYLAHNMPHIPLAATKAFRGKSGLGPYADVVQELDWSVGQVLGQLKDSGLDSNTLVMFSSDNGPWFQGSPGALRGRKGDTFEGGMREPFMAWWPGRIPAGLTVNSMATTMDVLPTVARFTGAPLPPLPLDGVDISPLLTGGAEHVERPPFLYLDGWDVQCARVGKWKLHMSRFNSPAYTPEPKVGRFNLRLINPELYDVDADPAESTDQAMDNPEIVESIRTGVEGLLRTMPTEVQQAWADTQARPVSGTVSGGWPTPL